MFTKIAVLGLGKVGLLAAQMLHETGFAVSGHDRVVPRVNLPFAVDTADLTEATQLVALCGKVEAVLSCLPYGMNRALAEAAHRAGIHYFDLTEDVTTMKARRQWERWCRNAGSRRASSGSSAPL